MRQNTMENRLRRAEAWALYTECHTCWNAGSVIVFVPEGKDATDAQFNPVACEECGRPLRDVRQIVGISEAEFETGKGAV